MKSWCSSSAPTATLTQLDSLQVRKLFLGLTVTQNGNRLWPVLNETDARVKEIFLQNIVSMSDITYDRSLLRLTLIQGQTPADRLWRHCTVAEGRRSRPDGRELRVVEGCRARPPTQNFAGLMARLRTSFANYVTVWVVLLHVALLPALFFGMGYVIRKSHEDLFVEHARTFARVLAEEFEAGVALDSRERTEDLLDLAISHGEARYAELFDRGRSIRSQLGSTDIAVPRHTDLGFAQGGDDIYFIVLPVVRSGHNAELRLGFDEQPTQDRIHLALSRMLWVLASYLSVAVGIAVILSYRLSRPIHRLAECFQGHRLGRLRTTAQRQHRHSRVA